MSPKPIGNPLLSQNFGGVTWYQSEHARITLATCGNDDFEGSVLLNSLLEVLILLMVVLENMYAQTMEAVPNAFVTSNPKRDKERCCDDIFYVGTIGSLVNLISRNRILRF